MDKKIRDSILKKISKVVQIGIVLIVFSVAAVGQDRMAALEGSSTVYKGIPITQDVTKSAVLNKIISINMQDVPLLEAAKKIAVKANLEMVYNSKLLAVKKRRITTSLEQVTVEKALWAVLKNTGLRFAVSADKQLVLLEQKEANNPSQLALAATQETITGAVTDAQNGETLPGVNILVKGTTTGTSTNADGNFELEVPSLQDTLVFTFVGYQSQEIPINGRTTIDIALQAEAISGDELVVVGYGTQRRQDLTGSISSVGTETLQDRSPTTADLYLQGQVPGLNLTQSSAEPGGATRIRIRGSNSLSGDNDPLFVIDGYPMPEGGEASSPTAGTQPTNFLAGLNPDDIKSIQVLKDASATAIYGSRGANGVILITTKAGTEDTRITFSSDVGIVDMREPPSLMNGRQYAQMQNQWAAQNGEELPYDGEARPTPESIGQGTPWVDLITRRGSKQEYGLSISGGDESTRYYLSGNFTNVQGVVRATGLNRGTLRLNLVRTISDRFSIRSRLNIGRVDNNRIDSGNGGFAHASPIWRALRSDPTVAATTEGGDLLRINPITGEEYRNPLIDVLETTNATSNQHYFAHLEGDYDILDNLNLVARAGARVKFSERGTYFPKSTNRGFRNNGIGYGNNYNDNNYTAEAYITFKDEFNVVHDVELMAGGSWQEDIIERHNTTVRDFPTDKLGTDAFHMALDRVFVGSEKIKSTLQSFYTRSNYTFNDKYLLTFTSRVDGSSKFAKNNKWGFFPSAAIAWRVSEEPFLRDSPFISNLKLRGSFGVTGSQAIPAYGSLSRLGIANYLAGDTPVSGVVPVSLGNDNLGWEETEQLNIGVDLGLFNDRLGLVLDYYHKKTEDLIQRVTIPITSGFENGIQNIGSIENKGIELQVNGDVFTGNFTWSSGLNISRNISKILELGGSIGEVLPSYTPGSAILKFPPSIAREGEPFGAFYGYKVSGLLQPDNFDSNGNPTIPVFSEAFAAPGHWKYVDINGDGVINPDDRTIIGDPNPDFIFGWSNNFSYKRFSMNIFIQGEVGKDVMNLNNAFFQSGWYEANQTQRWYQNRWTEDNPHNDPRYPVFGQNRAEIRPISAFVEDGSYLRLKNISLSYTAPPDFLPKVKSIKLYASATNLFTITGYSGFDPEVGAFGENLMPGIEYASYPMARQINIGIKLSL